MNRTANRRLSGARVSVLAMTLLLPAGSVAWAQQPPLSPDDQAAVLLNGARKAYDDGKFPLAAEQFKAFVDKYAGHKDAPAASLGLGLAIINQPQRDAAQLTAAIEQLTRAAGAQQLPERPFALYYLGVAQRSAGQALLAQIAARPNEAAALKQQAQAKFDEAGKQFAAALAAFADRAKTVTPPPQGDLPPELEWPARARADQCEMLLQMGKLKEAAELATPFLADPVLTRSKYRPLGLYHLGYASFAQKDFQGAGKALSQLAPFKQEFGPHARYLLARVHHLSDERPEAINQYKAALEEFDTQQKAAKEALKDPSKLDAEKKAQFEGIANGPAPDYVVRSSFYWAVLMYENGQYPEAGDRFAAIVQKEPKNSLATEAQLRLGFCRLQQRNFPETVKALDPLRDNATFGDRASWWLARATIAQADPANAAQMEQATKNASDLLRKAADLANKLVAANDAEAKVRRGDILIELGDTQVLAKQFKESAATYAQVLAENLVPDRAEELLQRRVTSLHLGGQYAESDTLAAEFEQKFPKSVLLGSVYFRAAENAYLTALAASEDANLKNNQPELLKRFDAAIAKYQKLLERFPEFEFNDHARQAIGISYQKTGRYQQAAEILAKIPEPSRAGDLATVSYVLADCLIRSFPVETDDAVTANRLIDNAEQAAKLLESFATGQPKSPQAPDALLKLGYCNLRIGQLLASPEERTKIFTKAREALDKCQQQYGSDPIIRTLAFERAKVLAAQGDAGGAIAELRKYLSDPYRANPNAPLALMRLSALLRASGNATEAAAILGKARGEMEPALSQDKNRSDWVAMLQYEHALALKESKKPAEAKALFDQVAKTFADQPAGLNAAWRAVQVRREELIEPLAKARAVLNRQGAKPDEVAAAYKPLEDGLRALGESAEGLRTRAETLGKDPKLVAAEPRQWMLYELAWSSRLQAEVETDRARYGLQQTQLEAVRAKLSKEAGGQATPAIVPPTITAAQVPLQPAEKKARDYYAAVIAAAPASAVANQSRYELAGILIARGETDPALEHLVVALENGPPADLADRIKIRAAACFVAREDAKNALANARPVMLNIKSELAAEARFLVGEAQILQKDWPKAIETLSAFRDLDPFRANPVVADRALLRLGVAYGESGNWDAARQSDEILIQRFAQSPWIDTARYAMGWALQQQKRYDEAATAYAEVTKRTTDEIAAKSLYNLGLCRFEQKKHAEAIKALQSVAYRYDYPEWSAAAWHQAGLVELDQKNPGEAAKCWQRVTKDFASTKWAALSQQELAKLPK